MTRHRHKTSREKSPGVDWQRILFAAFIAFLAVCVFGGGASRADVQSLVFVRVGAILLAVLACLIPMQRGYAPVRVPLILLGLLAALMAGQLLPLPAALWASLPGHSRYLEIAEVIGVAQPWRPLSLTPDLTLNSLLSIIPPFAVMIAMAGMRRAQIHAILPWVLGFAIVSAIFAIAQAAGGMDNGFYLYRITNESAPVGLFANRNHQAVFLAMAIPVVATWSVWGDARAMNVQARWTTATVLALLFVALLLATGSRAGFFFGIAGIVGAIAIIWMGHHRPPLPGIFFSRGAVISVGILLLMILSGALIFASRAETLNRVFGAAQTEDLRWTHFPLVIELAKAYFPFGSGFGSFDAVFRQMEPDSQLTIFFFNHAHNDLAELAITGGLPAMIILFGFLLWWGRRAWLVWKPGAEVSRTVDLARLGTLITGFLLAASLVDYPLRTPTLAVIFGIGCFWMAITSSRSAGGSANG